jgi:autotransporter-associated beta strand protein
MLTAAAVVIAFRAPMTRGANVMQIANDALGASSFTGATNWNPAGAPVAGNTYQSGFIFRTPSQSGNPAPFAGNSLEMLNGSEFRDKTGGTVTVGNLILDNTAIVSLTQPNNVNSATNTGTLAGSITVAFGATAVFLAGEQADTTGDTFTIAATISGTGGFTTAGTGAIANSRGAIILTASNSFTGVTTVQSASVGTLQLGNADAVRDSAVTIGTANTLTFSAGLGAFNLGGLAGSVNETLMDMAAAPVTLNVGLNNGVSTVYSGNLSGSGAVLDKIGGNTLTLSGAYTYTGGTTVSGGTLMVNGSLATGVIIASGATLGGNGTISGAVTNKVGGALHPGLGGTDTSTLFINNNLTLAGNTQFTLDRTNAQNASQIAGLATLTQGGGLIVNNAGPALQAGDTFTLFTAVNYTGSFSSINLPALASGLFWSNTIPINGAITVLSTNPELTPQLQHRYNFTSNANDLIGTANGTLPNGGTFGGGQLTFSSTNQQYLSLPGGIIDSNYPAVTIDMWATIQTGLPAFCYLFCIGDTDTNTDGYDYIFLNPQFARVTISAADPGFNGEQGGDFTTLAGANNLHITSVFNPPAGVISVYTNGVLSATFTGITDPLSVVGSQFTYVGRSLYNDSFFNWSISELRIYNIALSPLEIAAGDASGADSPNTNFGTVTNLQLQLPASQLALGGAESATVFAQTTLITNLANVTAYCTYLSGNTAVLTVDTNGLVTAVGPGSTTISARFANATATQTVTVPSASALLLHRYSFTSDASDSVGNANGTLQGNAAISGGAVVLDGVNSYVNLPGGLISSLVDVTF